MTVTDLYKEFTGAMPDAVEQIGSGSGSARSYFRLRGPVTLIGTQGVNLAENEAYLSFARLFEGEGLPVAKVVAVSPDRMTYLQEDLGDTLLFSLLGTDEWTRYAEQVMRLLPKFQLGTQSLPIDERLAEVTYFPTERMDRRSVMWDFNYFKYCFLKPSGIEPDEPLLEADFERLAEEIISCQPQGLILRDMQSRNVMIHNDMPWIIDFQGARRGPLLYDVVSFLWQAKARVGDEERIRLANIYLNSLPEAIRPEDAEDSLLTMALFRTLQVLGAYGFRGLIQNKVHFVESLPFAVENLRPLIRFVDESKGYAGELRRSLEAICSNPNYVRPVDNGKLCVEINSFGFRKGGIPRDFTGNGGGFVFDCRALPNPGRLPEFKTQTGRDVAVRQYLEDCEEVEPFIQNAISLVEPAVKRYIARGFSHLKVSFGCTGGQHRSVYCADRLSDYLRAKYADIEVITIHREQPQL